MSQEIHAYNGNRIRSPFPVHMKQAIFGMGCYWGAEKMFWNIKGTYSTMVGYSGGNPSLKPSYETVVRGDAPGYIEVVRVVYDPSIVSYQQLLEAFWEGHNPTQGNRQGNDFGEHYRSAIFCYNEETGTNATSEQQTGTHRQCTPSDGHESQLTQAQRSLLVYQAALDRDGGCNGVITTNISPVSSFHYAADRHQQYLHKNPTGYCPHHGSGVLYPRD